MSDHVSIVALTIVARVYLTSVEDFGPFEGIEIFLGLPLLSVGCDNDFQGGCDQYVVTRVLMNYAFLRV